VTSDAPGNLQGMTAEQVIDALGLEYLDGEGCWVRLLWRTAHANAIYALLTPTHFSAMHRLVHRIPAHTWQGSVSLGEWTLVTCVLAPPFSGFELADAVTDFAGWPNAESAIKRRMR